jgi:hypothetical protein
MGVSVGVSVGVKELQKYKNFAQNIKIPVQMNKENC